MNDKTMVTAKLQELLTLTDSFCSQYVDDDYRDVCQALLRKMSRKRVVPFMQGNNSTWAAGVVHAIGTINFLFDPNTNPYATADDISRHFGLAKNTISQKSKVIRDMFKLRHWDLEFSTAAMRKSNPYSQLVAIDGLLVPIEMLLRR